MDGCVHATILRKAGTDTKRHISIEDDLISASDPDIVAAMTVQHACDPPDGEATVPDVDYDAPSRRLALDAAFATLFKLLSSTSAPLRMSVWSLLSSIPINKSVQVCSSACRMCTHVANNGLPDIIDTGSLC